MALEAYNKLLEGKIIEAAWVAFDVPLAGWTIALLFFVFQIMLFVKTRNMTISYTLGLIFVAVFGSLGYIRYESLSVMFVLLILQLSGIGIMWLFKK